MRAASTAHPSEVTATHARTALVRLAIALFATLMLLAVWRPSFVHAQTKPVVASKTQVSSSDTATTTHVVKAGESLWAIAERYYGTGYQWQELARRNALVTTRPKVLLVGMKLRVPASVPAALPMASAGATVPAIARTPAVNPTTAAPVAANPAGAPAATSSLAAQTADKADAAATSVPAPAASTRGTPVASVSATPTRRVASAKPAPAPTGAAPGSPTVAVAPAAAKSSNAAAAITANASRMTPPMRAETLLTRQTTRIGLVERSELAAARGSDESTVFLRRVPEASEVDAQARAASRGDAPKPRRGEYEAAPFSVDVSTLAKGGALLRRIGAASAGSRAEPQRMMLVDEVEIAAPAGVSLSVGDRLVSVQLTPELSKGVRVAIPTGVVRVTRVEAGKPVVAVVQSQSGGMMQGQPLFMVEGAAAPLSARATSAVSDDISTSVRWTDASESIPTLQSFVLLDAGASKGVQAGDEFELRTAPTAGGGAGGERIARARIVRVAGNESAAIIVKQERADIGVGVAARRVARVP